MISFEIEPLDTLFFRGSIPMEAGMQNVVSMFPPPVSVLRGAFWTATCLKKEGPLSNAERFGNVEDMPKVQGFFLKKENKLYAPAPATWYYDYDGKEKIKSGESLKGKALLVAEDLEKKLKSAKNSFQIKTSAENLSFVKAEKEANSLNDCWIDLNFLKSGKKTFWEDTVLMKSDVYETENRTGIALDEKKHTVEGQLYTVTHIRLFSDITMVVVFDDEAKLAGLGDIGKLLLGGEKRIVRYKKLNEKLNAKIEAVFDMSSEEFDSENSVWFATVPIQADTNNLNELVASAKLCVTSGWDMAKGFHKPSVSWIPAGAVFNEKINNSCIPLRCKSGE